MKYCLNFFLCGFLFVKKMAENLCQFRPTFRHSVWDISLYLWKNPFQPSALLLLNSFFAIWIINFSILIMFLENIIFYGETNYFRIICIYYVRWMNKRWKLHIHNINFSLQIMMSCTILSILLANVADLSQVIF